jgi:hypothetical protein
MANLTLIPAKEYEKKFAVKKQPLRAIPADRPMSRTELTNFGVAEKTSALQRNIITNRLRHVYATGGLGGYSPYMGGEHAPLETEDEPLKVAAEIPKALAAGTEQALGTIGTGIRFAGEKMQQPVQRAVALGAPGVQIAQFIADKFGKAGPVQIYDKISKKLTKEGKFIADYWDEQASKGWEAPSPELIEAKWKRPFQYGARITFESAPTFAAAIGAGYVTGNPNISLAMMGAFEKLNSFRTQRAGGAGFTKADIISDLSGAWEAITEKIPFDFILKGRTKSKLTKMITAGSLEGLQELLAGMGQNFLQHFGYKAKDWKSIPGQLA